MKNNNLINNKNINLNNNNNNAKNSNNNENIISELLKSDSNEKTKKIIKYKKTSTQKERLKDKDKNQKK